MAGSAGAIGKDGGNGQSGESGSDGNPGLPGKNIAAGAPLTAGGGGGTGSGGGGGGGGGAGGGGGGGGGSAMPGNRTVSSIEYGANSGHGGGGGGYGGDGGAGQQGGKGGVGGAGGGALEIVANGRLVVSSQFNARVEMQVWDSLLLVHLQTVALMDKLVASQRTKQIPPGETGTLTGLRLPRAGKAAKEATVRPVERAEKAATVAAVPEGRLSLLGPLLAWVAHV